MKKLIPIVTLLKNVAGVIKVAVTKARPQKAEEKPAGSEKK
jgi:hypothetical protein